MVKEDWKKRYLKLKTLFYILEVLVLIFIILFGTMSIYYSYQYQKTQIKYHACNELLIFQAEYIGYLYSKNILDDSSMDDFLRYKLEKELEKKLE